MFWPIEISVDCIKKRLNNRRGMYILYKTLTSASAPFLLCLLKARCRAKKEIPDRLLEKQSITDKKRPSGKLLWIHAASVGEAQSTLILIKRFLEQNEDLNILVTTGTVTSAKIMGDKLPEQAFHQFYPLDHPKWVKKFIGHWRPDAVIWMESELWPNMLSEIKNNNIPAILVNAHMSEKSFNGWKRLLSLIKVPLSAFDTILCQTNTDKQYFDALGASSKTIVTDNLKYSAAPLAYDQTEFKHLSALFGKRPVWVYASTHKNEEKIACDIHIKLKERFPDILTIIVPRHPDRRDEIKETCSAFNLNITFRGSGKISPTKNQDVYVADTLGELGLFYSLSSITCIGRSFSDDGGGGHNPIEAAQLGCAVLHGPNVQNLQDIFDEMGSENAAVCVKTPEDLCNTLIDLLGNEDKLQGLQNAGQQYSNAKSNVIERVMDEIMPVFDKAEILGSVIPTVKTG